MALSSLSSLLDVRRFSLPAVFKKFNENIFDNNPLIGLQLVPRGATPFYFIHGKQIDRNLPFA